MQRTWDTSKEKERKGKKKNESSSGREAQQHRHPGKKVLCLKRSF